MSVDTGAQPPRYITDPPEPSEPDRATQPDGPEVAAVLGGSPSFSDGSLADRVKQRRQALETQQTETFDLPGYEGIIAAEFRLLAWTEGHKIGRNNSDAPDEELLLLYTTADCLLAAHTRFHEVHGTDRTPVEETWQSLCAHVGVPLPSGASDRVAMIALLEDVGVMSLWAEYEAWRTMRGRRITEQVVRDFNRTE